MYINLILWWSSRVVSFKVLGGASKPSSRKKDEDVDTSPLLQTNNLKNQRSIDEQKLKASLYIYVIHIQLVCDERLHL
jgi:hypothetical protein